MERLVSGNEYPRDDDDHEHGDGGWSRHREGHRDYNETGSPDPVGDDEDYGQEEWAETDQSDVDDEGWKRRARASGRGQSRELPDMSEYKTPMFARAADLKGTLKVERAPIEEEYIPEFYDDAAGEDFLADEDFLQRTPQVERGPREKEYVPEFYDDAISDDFF